MAILGRTERRLALAIVLVAVIPLIVAVYFASTLVDRAFAQAFTPELGEHLDQALGVYQDLAKALKDGMQHQAEAIAAREPLRAAAYLKHEGMVKEELDAVFPRYANLVSLGVATPDGKMLGEKTRGSPVDLTREVKRDLRVSLSEGPDAPQLVATFATPRTRFDELTKISEFVQAYHQIERARVKLKRGDLYAFAIILACTIVVAVALSTLLARSVTRRIGALALATHAVARGDLRVRVPEQGNDELTDLSRAFNRMLSEVEINRARIEFLQRMSTWQEMARRLAHEIKNPLTPILLAVEECHRKYAGDDPAFRKLLDTTLEIVEEEVGTLRRLVGEFSSFARLPRAELQETDLGEFMREQKEHTFLLLEERTSESEPPRAGDEERAPDTPRVPGVPVTFTFEIPDTPMPAALDRQMLHQVLTNIVRNAIQAVVAAHGHGQVRIKVDHDLDNFTISVDDDGPGVPPELRPAIFDPYFTTKADGTGLGLAIVKKIVVEHGGTIDVAESDLGGASFRIRIPRPTSPAAQAVQEMRPSGFGSGVRRS